MELQQALSRLARAVERLEQARDARPAGRGIEPAPPASAREDRLVASALEVSDRLDRAIERLGAALER